MIEPTQCRPETLERMNRVLEVVKCYPCLTTSEYVDMTGERQCRYLLEQLGSRGILVRCRARLHCPFDHPMAWMWDLAG